MIIFHLKKNHANSDDYANTCIFITHCTGIRMILLDQYEMGLIEEYPFGAGSLTYISMCVDSRSCKFLLYYYIHVHVSTCTVYIYIIIIMERSMRF